MVWPINWPEWINTKMQMHYLAFAEPALMHGQEKPSAAFTKQRRLLINVVAVGIHCPKRSGPLLRIQ